MHSWHPGRTAPEAVARLRLYLGGLLGERSAGPALVRRDLSLPLSMRTTGRGLSVALGSSQALSTVVHACGRVTGRGDLLYGNTLWSDSSGTFPAGTAAPLALACSSSSEVAVRLLARLSNDHGLVTPGRVRV